MDAHTEHSILKFLSELIKNTLMPNNVVENSGKPLNPTSTSLPTDEASLVKHFLKPHSSSKSEQKGDHRPVSRVVVDTHVESRGV